MQNVFRGKKSRAVLETWRMCTLNWFCFIFTLQKMFHLQTKPFRRPWSRAVNALRPLPADHSFLDCVWPPSVPSHRSPRLWGSVVTFAFSLLTSGFMSHHSRRLMLWWVCGFPHEGLFNYRYINTLLFSISTLVCKRPQEKHIGWKVNAVIECFLIYRNAAAGMDWVRQ